MIQISQKQYDRGRTNNLNTTLTTQPNIKTKKCIMGPHSKTPKRQYYQTNETTVGI